MRSNHPLCVDPRERGERGGQQELDKIRGGSDRKYDYKTELIVVRILMLVHRLPGLGREMRVQSSIVSLVESRFHRDRRNNS